ncbi:MAG TPA: hypothetical protein VN289_02275 [Paraburkholderia sp.]|nr:hypothetical protein [Paraburkholderia sp.]
MAGTLTVANSTITQTVEALYTSAQRIQGYAADDAFDFSEIENGEYSMGIDGKLSAGFVFNAIPFTLTLQADSPSIGIYENVWQYEVTNRTKLTNQLTVSLPAVGKRYELKDGFMQSYKAPSGKKILQPGVAVFTFARLQVSPI